MLADIMSNNPDVADVSFLVAVILAAVSFALSLGARAMHAAIGAAALAFLAFGLLAL